MAETRSTQVARGYDGSTPAPRKPVGRPRKIPPADAAERIQALAADGWTELGIAKGLGVDKETLVNWLSEYPELKDAKDLGRESEHHVLRNEAFRLAMEAEREDVKLRAIMFLLNCRHGYRDSDPQESGARVSVTLTVPLPMSPEDYMKSLRVANE